MTINKIKDKAIQIPLPENHRDNESYAAGQTSYGKVPVFIFYDPGEFKAEYQPDQQITAHKLNRAKQVVNRNVLL
ncbi:MAG TPA: hypothetical protein VNX40_04320 [Mucilaginibacter sp.]|jgi:hypothetical protein|nr:hypothetical protein [Mucilaginibacter sp.]